MWRRTADCVQVVRFQRSVDSGADWIPFTVNVGSAYAVLPSVVGWTPSDRRLPQTFDCHADVRIGYLLPDRTPDDYWWLIDANTDADALERSFAALLRGSVTDHLERLSTLDGLIRYWRAKGEDGSIEDRELRWWSLLDDALDVERIAARPQRVARRRKVKLKDMEPIDFSQTPLPHLIETPRGA